jgi:leucyl-tRNA synthetase
VNFEIHSVLRQANYDLAKHQFNTVASAAMKILNALERVPGGHHETVIRDGLSILLRLLSPITPHICHALWRELKFGADILKAPWPEPDPKALDQDEIEYVIQINGKKKGSLKAPKGLDQPGLEQLARASPLIKKYIGEQAIRKIIIVPGKLINIVV